MRLTSCLTRCGRAAAGPWRCVASRGRASPRCLITWPGGRQIAGLPGRIEESFRRQLEALPEQTRRLLALAAADPSAGPLLVWRAAGRLGIAVQAGAPTVEAGLAEFGARVRFRHPLARSAAYLSVSAAPAASIPAGTCAPRPRPASLGSRSGAAQPPAFIATLDETGRRERGEAANRCGRGQARPLRDPRRRHPAAGRHRV
jgi:hypothetical protein